MTRHRTQLAPPRRRGMTLLEVLVSTVLNLPTIGPLLLTATMNQDMYLAGSIVLILSSLTLIGTFLSDIILAIVDPRIRYE